MADGKEWQELQAACAAADPELAAADAALRACLQAVGALASTTALLQREAADVEFEQPPAAIASHIDGVLLQRVGFVSTRAGEAQVLLRRLAQGVRDLRADCAATVALRVPE